METRAGNYSAKFFNVFLAVCSSTAAAAELSVPIKIDVGGLLHLDARVFDEPESNADEFIVRRARIEAKGKIGDTISFLLRPEYGNGQDGSLFDAYADWQLNSNNSLRIGKFKTPIGLERVQSISHHLFVEPALTDNLVPNRDVGIAWNIKSSWLQFNIGVGNNVGDRQNTNDDTDDSKTAFTRIFFTPWPDLGLNFGVAGSLGKSENNNQLPSYRTSLGQNTVFRYSTNWLRDGDETRWAPQYTWYLGRFGSYGEYVSSELTLSDGSGATASVTNTSWQVAVSWLLTDDQASWQGVTPNHSGGAWEILVRLAELNLEEGVEFADEASLPAEKLLSAAVGVNWYVNANTKVQFNYEQTQFDELQFAQNIADEKTFAARLQLSF